MDKSHSNYQHSPAPTPRQGGGKNCSKKGKMVGVKGGNRSGIGGSSKGGKSY